MDGLHFVLSFLVWCRIFLFGYHATAARVIKQRLYSMLVFWYYIFIHSKPKSKYWNKAFHLLPLMYPNTTWLSRICANLYRPLGTAVTLLYSTLLRSKTYSCTISVVAIRIKLSTTNNVFAYQMHFGGGLGNWRDRSFVCVGWEKRWNVWNVKKAHIVTVIWLSTRWTNYNNSQGLFKGNSR